MINKSINTLMLHLLNHAKSLHDLSKKSLDVSFINKCKGANKEDLRIIQNIMLVVLHNKQEANNFQDDVKTLHRSIIFSHYTLNNQSLKSAFNKLKADINKATVSKAKIHQE